MLRRFVIVLALAGAFAPSALARGGNYVFDGGTRAEQAQVRAALAASSFDWGLVPGRVVIHVGRVGGSYATAGHIWLDAGLLDGGRFAWGVVQHEYAHQVDFAVLTTTQRSQLHTLLGGDSWWGSEHSSADCERFADALAWAYWQSPDNVMRPQSASDEGGQVAPAAFRAALDAILQPVRVLAAAKGTKHPRNG
ncbi:MAG TPA: hypothetical protein VFA56_05515 [Gaiellaceae bacterium]|nr:hypothetical protein [Gaiellaceae bacterium]